VLICFFNSRTVLSLQIAVAVFVQTCLALEVTLPDPVDCSKFYHLSDSDLILTHETCPDGLVFNWHDNTCEVGSCTLVKLEGLEDRLCSGIHRLGFFCNSNTTFTYCAHHKVIAEHVHCPLNSMCNFENEHPCMWEVLLTISTSGKLTTRV
jgi:hypothetical protein